MFSTDWITESVGDMFGNKSVNVIQEGKTYEGYFHKFTDCGKAIVERFDGVVYEVSADSVVFTDRDCDCVDERDIIFKHVKNLYDKLRR